MLADEVDTVRRRAEFSRLSMAVDSLPCKLIAAISGGILTRNSSEILVSVGGRLLGPFSSGLTSARLYISPHQPSLALLSFLLTLWLSSLLTLPSPISGFLIFRLFLIDFCLSPKLE